MNTQITIEIILAIAVVLLQLFFFYASFVKIKNLSDLLPNFKLDNSFLQTSDTTNGSIQLIKNDSNLFSIDFSSVVNSINEYLLQNQGTTDYSIIKSIVDRSIETKENSVGANVSLPLYIGLMGTFTGIIIGLLKIPFGGGVNDENINSFIGGVVIAMVASFFGLLLTVLNNSMNFRKAKSICDERKNNLYDFLQIQLLPHLSNSLFDALDRLKNNINDFNKKFENNISLFDTKFSANINSLGNSVSILSRNIDAIVENTETQKEFLLELKKLGYNRLAEANMRVFTLIKDIVPTLVEFVDKQKRLNQIVNNAGESVKVIESILNRLKTFEDSINRLGENINTKQYLSGQVIERVDKNLSQLDKNFELLKRHEIQSSEAIEEFFKNQYKKVQELVDSIKREVESALDLKIENNPLQKLLLLETLDKNMEEIKSKINFNGEFKKISEEVTSTKLELSDIKQSLIKAIEDRKGRQTEIVIHGDKSEVNENKTNKEEDKSKVKRKVFNRFTNLFKWNRGRKA